MERLCYGSPINGYSSMLREGYEDVQLYLGRANTYNDDRRVASFEMYGISVLVTAQSACERINTLYQSKNRKELISYLESILFLVLQRDPNYILSALQERYEEGVADGKQQKAAEIRNVLCI